MTDCIPKVIHYCWFGGKKKPKSVQRCLKSWKKYLPDYKIKEWNEKNFSIQDAPDYVKEAYAAKKYAFVSDYARIKALYKYGGLYFDTDLEVLSRFDEYLKGNDLILAFEGEGLLMTAFIACSAHHPFIKQFMASYENRHFLLENGEFDMRPNTFLWSSQAEEWGADLTSNSVQRISETITVYPEDVFSGFDILNYHEKITANTRTVHHLDCSWGGTHDRIRKAVLSLMQKTLGYKRYDSVKGVIRKLKGRSK